MKVRSKIALCLTAVAKWLVDFALAMAGRNGTGDTAEAAPSQALPANGPAPALPERPSVIHDVSDGMTVCEARHVAELVHKTSWRPKPPSQWGQA